MENPPPAGDDWLTALQGTDTDQAVAAAAALGAAPDPRMLAPLVVALREGNWQLRAAAATALGALGDARAVGPLMAALKRPDPYTRAAAAEALGRLEARPASAALLAALRREDDETVQEALVTALEHIGTPAPQVLAVLDSRLAAEEVEKENSSGTKVLWVGGVLTGVSAAVTLGSYFLAVLQHSTDSTGTATYCICTGPFVLGLFLLAYGLIIAPRYRMRFLYSLPILLSGLLTALWIQGVLERASNDPYPGFHWLGDSLGFLGGGLLCALCLRWLRDRIREVTGY